MEQRDKNGNFILKGNICYSTSIQKINTIQNGYLICKNGVSEGVYVYSTDSEIARMKENGVFIAHCPASNRNLSSGIAPIRKYIDAGIQLGLGSDVAGGHTNSIFRAIAESIQVSKLYWRIKEEEMKPLNLEEAFYMATKGGGAFFGKVGSFEKGYEFDAIVLNDSILPHPQELSVLQRLERAIYLALDINGIAAKYVAGRKITPYDEND